MKNMSKNILIIVTLFVLVAVVGYVVTTNQTSTPEQVANNDCSSDYKHSFDTPVSLGDSGVTVRYPSEGFFGHGASVSQETTNGRTSLEIRTTEDYRAECGEEFVTVGVNVRKAEVDTLDEVVDADMKSYAGYGERENPRFVTLNGQRYFTYYTREGLDDIEVVTLQNGMVIYAFIAYKETDFNDAMTVLSRNQDLLLEFMSQISVQ